MQSRLAIVLMSVAGAGLLFCVGLLFGLGVMSTPSPEQHKQIAVTTTPTKVARQETTGSATHDDDRALTPIEYAVSYIVDSLEGVSTLDFHGDLLWASYFTNDPHESQIQVFSLDYSEPDAEGFVELTDVGGAALYFLSDLSAGVTGTIHFVDAGYHAIGLPHDGSAVPSDSTEK